MASRRYLNFDLLVEQEGEGRYEARVTDSPIGESASVYFQLPFDATTLENLLLKLDPGRSGTRRVGASGQQQAAMDFGGPLYDTVFSGDLALAWQRSLDRARAEDAGGLRLRLRLTDAAAISGLPWELLYDARNNAFLAQSERTPVVRFLDVPQSPRPMTVDGPLRILAVISSPIDLEELDVDAEERRLREALAPRVESGLVVIDRLPSATLGELGDWLRRHSTHVIHFVGHGDFDARLREGVVYFQDEHGKSSPVTSSVLGPFIRDHDPLRMVVLNACRSARSDAVDPFAGMAQGLVQQDATAVVAMQFPISDRAAVTFTGEFYGALVDGLPVDQAVTSARKALLADFREEWATPVLFMRSPDGTIFENVHAVGEPVPIPEAVPEEQRPRPPGPSFWKSLVLLVSRQKRLVAAALGLVVLLVAVAAWVLRDDDSEQVDVLIDLPRSEPLPATQMLVAAGPTREQLRIWLVDVADVARSVPVSLGRRKEWLPVLSPDRATVVYSRRRANSLEDFQLRVAEAATGESDRALFASPPSECSDHAGRPAWSQQADPADRFIVLRCRSDEDDRYRLVKVDARGEVETLEVLDENGTPWAKYGDPTVSPDGSLVVLWVTNEERDEAGSLYAITLPDGESHKLLAGAPREYSDPVFSPSTEELRIAYRKNVGGNFDIWTATLDGARILTNVPLVATSATEEDPTFSPDGSQVAFTRVEKPGSTIYRIPLDGSSEAVAVPTVDKFQRVAAWSTR